MAIPAETSDILVRNQARKVRSSAKWSRATDPLFSNLSANFDAGNDHQVNCPRLLEESLSSGALLVMANRRPASALLTVVMVLSGREMSTTFARVGRLNDFELLQLQDSSPDSFISDGCGADMIGMISPSLPEQA